MTQQTLPKAAESRQYAERDAMALDAAGNYYIRHAIAMTGEGLHAKSAIAAELAWRDMEIDRLRAALAAPDTFQARVQPWLMQCFGPEIGGDTVERNHRFLEESLELVQACGCTASEAHQLVEYVFARPVGEKPQETGGVMVTLAALCLAQKLDMHMAGEAELARIWTKVEAIRAKQAAKPKHSPLPATQPDRVVEPEAEVAGLKRDADWRPASEPPSESEGEVLVSMADGRHEVAWATYWHGASNAFAQWTFRDPDETERPTHWMRIPAIRAHAPKVTT